MLEEILTYLNNWFTDDSESWYGGFTISGGIIELGLYDTQHYRILGSKFNDGLHQHPADDLEDETFAGAVQVCNIPKPLLKLADEIEAWCERYGDAASSPFASESFGGYSYSKGSTREGDGEAASGWVGAFAGRLARWKKL